jgi:hypothetical protein
MLSPITITMSDCVRSDVAVLEAIACEISVLLALASALAIDGKSRDRSTTKPDPIASGNAGRRTVLALLGAVK